MYLKSQDILINSSKLLASAHVLRLLGQTNKKLQSHIQREMEDHVKEKNVKTSLKLKVSKKFKKI